VDDSHLVLCKFDCITIVVSAVTRVKNSRLPTDNCVLTALGEDKVTEPLATVHVVTMDVSGAEVRKMTQFCGENFLCLQSHMAVGELYGGLNIVRVHPPHLQTVVHAAGDDLGPVHVEVRAEHLVPVALDPAKYGDVVLRLDVPQSQGVVLGHGEEKIGILGMELELVDGIAVPDKVSDTVHAGGTEDPDDAPAATSGQDWPPRVTVPRPGARVEVLVGVGISVALEQLDTVRHHLVDGDPVVAHRGEHHGVRVGEMMVDGDSEYWMSMILPPITDTFVIQFWIVLTTALPLLLLLVILDHIIHRRSTV